jgi:hypothetical protein
MGKIRLRVSTGKHSKINGKWVMGKIMLWVSTVSTVSTSKHGKYE